MTFLRSNPGAVSNYFNSLFQGVGHRGSSFMDLDRVDYHVTHDGRTNRVLIFEFKGPNESTNQGQWKTLKGLIKISPQIEAWALRVREDEMIDFFDMRRSTSVEVIEPGECRCRFELWWKQASTIPPMQPRMSSAKCKHRPEFIENGRCRICQAMGVPA